jgi:hypothetical protein
MYYEERLINGVTYFRHTPNGKWIEKVIDKGVHAGSMAIPVKNCLIAEVGGSLRELADKYEKDALERYENGDQALSHLHMAEQARYGFEDGWKADKKQ